MVPRKEGGRRAAWRERAKGNGAPGVARERENECTRRKCEHQVGLKRRNGDVASPPIRRDVPRALVST